LNYYIKDNNEIIAGINSCFYFEEVLCVNVLFVKDEYRGRGIGSLLLSKVEETAKKIGAKLSHLHTFDFNNAKEFYLQHGYEIFGVLEDCPTGYKHYYFKKTL
jgi:GNAT superfamily N-acetyltransferase